MFLISICLPSVLLSATPCAQNGLRMWKADFHQSVTEPSMLSHLNLAESHFIGPWAISICHGEIIKIIWWWESTVSSVFFRASLSTNIAICWKRGRPQWEKSTNSYSCLDLSKYISRIYVSVTKLLPLFSCPAYGANIEFIMFCMFYSFEMDV